MKNHLDIDGRSCWPGEARPWYKRFLRRLYVKYVGDAYLPKAKSVELVREKQRSHPKFNKITHVVIHGGGFKLNGTYILGQFDTEIHEQEPKL